MSNVNRGARTKGKTVTKTQVKAPVSVKTKQVKAEPAAEMPKVKAKAKTVETKVKAKQPVKAEPQVKAKKPAKKAEPPVKAKKPAKAEVAEATPEVKTKRKQTETKAPAVIPIVEESQAVQGDNAISVKENVTECLTCCACIHLNYEPLDGKLCSLREIRDDSATCGRFKPYIHQLRSSDIAKPNPVIELFRIINNMPTSNLPILASLLIRDARTRKNSRYSLGQIVYVCQYGTGRYISDYVAAYVLDCDREYLRLIGATGTMILQVPIDSDSILTEREFKPVYKRLAAEGKSANPQKRETRTLSPTVVRMFDELSRDNEKQAKKKEKFKPHKTDLARMYSHLAG